MKKIKLFDTNRTAAILLYVFLPFTGVYFITAFFNQINAMLAPYLFHDIGITASQLGLTTAIYLLIFALAQLPLGIFLDRYGPKKVQCVLFIVAAFGIVVFLTSTNMYSLLVGRGLIGIGVSSGLMSGFRAIRSWIPKEKVPLANGCLMASGTLGAVFSTLPAEFVLHIISWRAFLVIILILMLIVTAWLYFFSPDTDLNKNTNFTFKQQIFETKHVFRSAYFWKIAPLVSFAFGSNMSIVGLWAGPWLSDVALLNKAEIASHLFVISMALVFGIALWGIIADKLTVKYNFPITYVIGFGSVLYILVQILLITDDLSGSYFVWFLFGFMSRYTTLAYAAVSQHFACSYAGRATTALNMLFFLTAFFAQLGMGYIVNIWPTNFDGHYLAQGYYVAFSIIIALQIFGFIWFLMFKKTHN